MTTFSVLPPPPEPPGFNVGIVLPAINPSAPPATIPISFVSDLGAQPPQIVSQAGVLTGNERLSGGGIQLPLPPLPTPSGARVSMLPGAYPLDYQTAGSNLLETAATYTAALAVYTPVLTTFLGSASWAAYVAAGETGAALLVLIATSDYQTWINAWGVAIFAYGDYVRAYNAGQSALNWWSTWANAVLFFNANPLRANPYSSVNPI